MGQQQSTRWTSKYPYAFGTKVHVKPTGQIDWIEYIDESRYCRLMYQERWENWSKEEVEPVKELEVVLKNDQFSCRFNDSIDNNFVLECSCVDKEKLFADALAKKNIAVNFQLHVDE